MVAPSKSFTVIPDSDIDPDSPITTGLMTNLRDNDVHTEEWLGDSFVAAKDHDHDGVNSKVVDGASVAVQFIESINQGSTVTDVDFATTLDGDTDEQWILTGFVRLAVTSDLQLRANSVNETGNTDAGITSPVLLVERPGANIVTAFFQAWMKVISDADVTLDSRHVIATSSIDAGASSSSQTRMGQFSPGTGVNITSIGFHATAASGIITGSRFSIYKITR